MATTTPEDTRPPELRERTYLCGGCGAVMLRTAADCEDGAPVCPICRADLDDGAGPRDRELVGAADGAAGG